MNKRSNQYLVLFILSLLLVIILYYSYSKDIEFMSDNKNIIGYFHVCQKENWEKSYDLIFDSIKKSGLYDVVKEIRIGVLNDNGSLIYDERFNDDKIKIVHIGKSDEYEIPTLLHMKKFSEIDSEDTYYFYLHTKGIRHYNTKNEKKILDWINDMLYWNITRWKTAIEKLKYYETYGCNYNNIHYSGNFWWATSKHVKKLPNTIGKLYTDPEDWILLNKDNLYCVNNCYDDNYIAPYPEGLYK